MPDMNGVTLAREARKRRPGLPVVVLTGYASEAADAAGEADFALLRKPIDSDALIGRVSALIGAALNGRRPQLTAPPVPLRPNRPASTKSLEPERRAHA